MSDHIENDLGDPFTEYEYISLSAMLHGEEGAQKCTHPNPASVMANVESNLLDPFRSFDFLKKMRLSDLRRERESHDKKLLIDDLKKFSKNFNLTTPVPTDLLPILAKDKSKQEEIMEKAQQNAQQLSNASARATTEVELGITNKDSVPRTIMETMKQESVPKTLTASAVETTTHFSSRKRLLDRSGWAFKHILDISYGKRRDAPELIVRKATTSRVVGTIQGPILWKTTDITVNDKPIPLEAMGAVSTGRTFTSYAEPGRKFKWIYDNALSHGLECVDEEEKVVASWDGSLSTVGGYNAFEFDSEIEGELLEEVLVSGLAMVEQRAKRNRFGDAVRTGLWVACCPFKGSTKREEDSRKA